MTTLILTTDERIEIQRFLTFSIDRLEHEIESLTDKGRFGADYKKRRLNILLQIEKKLNKDESSK